jgi:hypothetical protein
MDKYNPSQVVPSLIKVRDIKDNFQKEYENFISDYSPEAFDEYSRYMRAWEKYPRNEDEEDFLSFEHAFYDNREAWNFIREIIESFGYINKCECVNCFVRATCFNNMDDTRDVDCEEVYWIRDFKIGFILFLYLKYFKTEKASLIYD